MKLIGNYQIKQVADQKVAIYCTEDTADLRRAVSLTGSAEIIFKQLLSGAEKDDLIKCLTDNYDISEETAKKDVTDFLKLLYSYNLLDG